MRSFLNESSQRKHTFLSLSLTMISICNCASFSATTQNGFAQMKRIHGLRNLSMSSFTGARKKGYFQNKHQCKFIYHKQSKPMNQGRGALFMWGESESKNAFSTSWFDDDDDKPKSRNQDTGSTRRRDSERRSNNYDDQRSFRRSSNASKGSGWDDFEADGNDDSSYEPYEYQRKGSSRGGGNRGDKNSRGKFDRSRRNSNTRNQDWDSSRDRQNFKRKDPRDRKKINAETAERKVNMRALQKAGYEHLYGIAPVLNALKVEKRDMEAEENTAETGRKPEAQFTPYLFVQDNIQESKGGSKSGDKARAVKEILTLVEQADVPVAYADKGVLNALSNNRPHQVSILCCCRLSQKRFYLF